MTAIPCMLMRGGTSKGAFFVADDLPADPDQRDALLVRIMGSPDIRQIDGIGGATPLTSKVAVIGPSARADADIDYLFLQVSVDQALVSDRQNCGNLLAATAPFAIERGIIDSTDSNTTTVRVYMANSDSIATATIELADGMPEYRGQASIDGVPGTAAPIRLDFENIAGGSCGALLPTGNLIDSIDGIEVTMIDNGMPVVVIGAADLAVTGTESRSELETNETLRARLESIRVQAGHLMNLGDVTETTVPKLTMVSAPTAGGDISTRTFIPHRCHEAIGVFGAVSVATAALLPGTIAADVVQSGAGSDGTLTCEHPSGAFTAVIHVDASGGVREVRSSGIIRTARKLMDGTVFATEYGRDERSGRSR